jgi:putative tryptophan/tyrosine transport system substrate-binding protein
LAGGRRMRRRDFMGMFSAGVIVSPFPLWAQQPAAPVPVIGVLHGVAAAQWTDRMAGFDRGLSESGLVDGRNITIEYRWADGQFDRLPAMAADLVSRRAAVICAGASDVAIRAAMAATKTIPIVFTTASDPVRAGFVSSVSRPGGNVTGATFMGVELVAKRIELLRDTVRGATRIALLVNPNNPGLMQDNIDLSRIAVQRLGLEMVVVRAGGERDIESAVLAAVRLEAHALYIGNDAYLASRSGQIATLALRHALPTMSESRNGVTSGLLMSYGPNQAETFRQAALYIGRVLKGQKPADLPVIQPTLIELFINLATAKALSINMPAHVLARADEIIE